MNFRFRNFRVSIAEHQDEDTEEESKGKSVKNNNKIISKHHRQKHAAGLKVGRQKERSQVVVECIRMELEAHNRVVPVQKAKQVEWMFCYRKWSTKII